MYRYMYIYVHISIHIYICIYIYIYMSGACIRKEMEDPYRNVRLQTNGVSTNRAAAKVVNFDRL